MGAVVGAPWARLVVIPRVVVGARCVLVPGRARLTSLTTSAAPVSSAPVGVGIWRIGGVGAYCNRIMKSFEYSIKLCLVRGGGAVAEMVADGVEIKIYEGNCVGHLG